VVMTIRSARSGDYDDLCALFEQVDALHRQQHPELFREPDGPPRPREYLLALIADPQAALFVAQVDGQLGGFVSALLRQAPPYPILVPRRFAVVDDLVVRADLRRMGLGRALMAQVERWARANGATAVELNVYAFNQGAIDFYEALGYQAVSHKLSKPLK
jgi:ribosomal protein S18 acetylase RimI-like enzyme